MKFIAHRGASFFEPENTLRALKRAVEMGADMVEVDVRLSRDGELVVMHDPTLDRTTDGRGRVEDMTLGELKRLNAGRGELIPTLQEVIEAVRGTGLVIEMKIPGIEEMVLEKIHENRLKNVMITSFYHGSLRKVRMLDENIKTGAIFSCQPVKPERMALDAGADAIFPAQRFVNGDMIKSVHGNDIQVYPWTVDSPERAKELMGLGVDGMVTNRLLDFKG